LFRKPAVVVTIPIETLRAHTAKVPNSG
jgi:hypothetical protein